jgi:aryl-alcohol dehydrogenase-like predicted oxidoreductase
VAVEHKIAVVPYYSLASGFLSGKYRTKEDTKQGARGSRVEKYLNERGTKIIDALVKVAKRYDTTPATVALAWLIARPSITAPIASATSVKQLESLAEATRISIDKEDLAALTEASDVE